MEGILNSIIYFIIGILACALGYKIFDWITPFSLDKEIDEHNIAAGIVIAGIFISVALVVSAAII